MADATTITRVTVSESDSGCGCCRPPEPKSTDEMIRELESRREALEARLAGIGAR